MREEFEGFVASRFLEDFTVEELLKAAKYKLFHGNVKKTRESSLVQTKLDEALLWLSQCNFMAEDD